MNVKKIVRNVFSERVCSSLAMISYNSEARKYRQLLEVNKEFEGKYKGKRCFVLGNGPSLNEVDFSKLENEVVFTVNQIARKNGYEKLNIDFHFWADPFFFRLDPDLPEDKELLEQMLKVRTEGNNPICFFPVEQYEFIKKYIGDRLNTRFFFPKYAIKNRMKKDIKFDKVLPSFYTVVQYAITLAVYMGFEEIYLLGCETSNIMTSLNTRLNVFSSDSYSYTLTENEKKRMKKINEMTSVREDLYNNLCVIEDYYYLKEFCSERGIKLFNCTPGGLLDEIERRRLETVIDYA